MTGADTAQQNALRPVDEHRRRVAGLIPAPRVVEMAVDQALGRVLADDVIAPQSLPGFDNSAMDGYAVRAAETIGATTESPVALPVTADIPAGRTDELTLEPGAAHRIMTGAPMPAGADAVIPVERTDGGTTRVAIGAQVSVGASVRRAGSDIEAGEVALRAGATVTAPVIGLLCALGLAHVRVYAPISVVVLSTGSELVTPGTPLRHGQIHESNGPMLVAALTEAGADATAIHFVPDDVAAFRARLDEIIATTRVDLILTSGGVSAGAYEVVKDALTGPDVEFVKVAMQPGMPQGSGHYRAANGTRVPIVTLPGNPVSAQVSFEVFLRDPVRASMGLATGRPRITAELTTGLSSPKGKRQFRRGIVVADEQGTRVEPIGPPSSHHIRFMASANALIDVAADVETLAAGTPVEVMLISE
ncbi:molybdopterin molybdotransferase MoeA [Gordonia jinhuaensis]|uniref:Molybdopterin molybdenumtransferase n=1 Tax=Gordonia jinhuaensis TaxID=1517702 RepID=A0A916SX21_9ACTN|nr:putative molybdopterin biosynthesis protein MoeA [Gordonia jinhuaensis]